MTPFETNDRAHAGAVRHASPMLRSAKVVCQSGEYVCLVRDVSQEGVLLSFLHETPLEPRLILALANEQTYPLQRVWTGETQAGYRFAGPVSLAEFLHERSPFAVRPVCLKIAASARLVDGADSHTARLIDLSTHGAKLDAKIRLGCERRVLFQAHGMTQRPATIVWSKEAERDARHGLQFSEPLTLRELAQASLRMQPFGPGAPTGADTDHASAA